MRALLLLLLLAACARIPPRVAAVPLVTRCPSSIAVRAWALIVPPRSVVTVSHATRCPDGLAPLALEAAGTPVVVDAYDGDAVRLVARYGEPWAGAPEPHLASVGRGSSGGLVLDEHGEVLGVLEDAIGDLYVRAVNVRRLVEGASRVQLEGIWP